MAFSDKQWETVKAYYERGLSLSEIVGRDEVEIKSRSQISKKAAKEGWVKDPKKKQLIESEVIVKQELALIKETKETLKETELAVHNKLVEQKLRIANSIADFNELALIKAKSLLSVSESGTDFKAIVDGVDKVSITAGINPRHAEPSKTTIQNNTQNNYETLTDDDLVRESKKLRLINETLIGK